MKKFDLSFFAKTSRYEDFRKVSGESKRHKRRIIVALTGISLFIPGMALADYVLRDGTQVKWLGGNTIEITRVNSDGSRTVTTTSNTTRSADGRLVARDSSMNSNQVSEAGRIGRQDTGGDSRFRAGVNTVTIPVYQSGRFVGYANNHQDASGLGRTYYTSNTSNGRTGTAVINGTNGNTADFNWTRVDLSTPTPQPTAPRSSSGYLPSPSPSVPSPPPPPPTNLLRSTSISHNPAWETIRVQHQRTPSQFYAGEKFVVRATTTFDATSVQVSFQFPQATADLSPAFRDPSEPARPSLAATFSLSKQNTYDWQGTFWKKSWASLPDGQYTATIRATFQNGQTRTATHTLQILNSILDFANGIEKVDQ